MNAAGLVLLGSVLGLLIGCLGIWAAYRNGVTDGFGFAWEPTNPGYRKAGLWLHKNMTYRWRQLGNPNYFKALHPDPIRTCATSDFENARHP